MRNRKTELKAPLGPVFRGVLGTILVLVLVASSSSAGESTFNPRVSVVANYTDNVAFVTGPSGEPDESAADASTRLMVLLPFSNKMEHGSLDFAYETGYSAYRVYDNLNFIGHRLSFGYVTTPSRSSTLSLFSSLLLTQDQGNSSNRTEDDVDFFLSERTERQHLDVGLSYSKLLGPRWRWDIATSVARARVKYIEGTNEQNFEDTVEDRDAFRVSTGFDHPLSRKTSIGARYRFQFTALETSPNESFHALVVTAGRRLSEKTYLGFEIGGFKRIRDESEDSSPQDFRDSGLYASLNIGYSRVLGPVQLGFDMGVRPTSGGALTGTATNATAAMFVTGAHSEKWNWNLTTRYTRRQPSERSEPTTETFSANGTVERSINRVLGWSFFAQTAKQDLVDQDPTATPGLTGSVLTVGTGLVWYPLGRMKIARGV